MDEFLPHCRTPWGKVAPLSILLLTGRINCDATFPHKAVWNSWQGVRWNEIWCTGHYEAWRPRRGPAQKVRWWLCSRGYRSWERPACGNEIALSLHPISVRYTWQRIFRLGCSTSKLLLWKLWLSQSRPPDCLDAKADYCIISFTSMIGNPSKTWASNRPIQRSTI